MQPDIMGGRACIRGMRVSDSMFVCQLGAARSIDELLPEYPYLDREDILRAILFAASRLDDREDVVTQT
jgi:uncharacterized protein (DUF433 family)